jgi:hypothetical protein
MHTDQLVQIAGAILILAAFIGAQAGRLDMQSRAYLVLNLTGAGILATIAAVERDWGFLLLEGVWTLVSAWSLAQVVRGGGPRQA